jgi:hypothetical protein
MAFAYRRKNIACFSQTIAFWANRRCDQHFVIQNLYFGQKLTKEMLPVDASAAKKKQATAPMTLSSYLPPQQQPYGYTGPQAMDEEDDYDEED